MALFSRVDRTYNLELVRDGDAVVEEVHVGGVGPRRERFGDAVAALAAFQRRVLELLGDGWALSQVDGDLEPAVACDAALEAKIVEANDAERASLLAVYADWLGERGDACGDLAALRVRDERGHTDELGMAIQKLELARELELFGLLTRLPNFRAGVVPMWRDGWIDGYDFVSSDRTLATFALRAPMARFVRTLVFRHEQSEGVRAAISMWSRKQQVRRLALPHTSYAQELLDVLPRLDEVTMWSGTRTPGGHPTVRLLVLDVAEVRKGRRLIGSWPAVAKVVVRYHGRGKPPSALDVIDEAALPARPEIVVRAEKR